MIQAGFNHNIRYKGVLFHVQTEDYGLQKHIVVTQLFHGGTILGKVQTDYSEFLGLDDVSAEIHELMKVQHIKMLKDLVGGKIAIPSQIFMQGDEDNINSKPVLDLDKEEKKENFETTVSRFLDDK